MFYLKYNQRGMGLIELIFGVAIMLLVTIPILASLFSGVSTYQYTFSQCNNITSARNIYITIADEIRYSKTISIPTLSEVHYTVENQSRKIYIGSGSDANTIIIERGGNLYNKIAVGRVQKLEFKRDRVTLNEILIEVALHDNSNCKSPDLPISNIAILLPNVQRID